MTLSALRDCNVVLPVLQGCNVLAHVGAAQQLYPWQERVMTIWSYLVKTVHHGALGLKDMKSMECKWKAKLNIGGEWWTHLFVKWRTQGLSQSELSWQYSQFSICSVSFQKTYQVTIYDSGLILTKYVSILRKPVPILLCTSAHSAEPLPSQSDP